MEFTENGVLLESLMDFPTSSKKSDIIGLRVGKTEDSPDIVGVVIKAVKRGASDTPGMSRWSITSEVTEPNIVNVFRTIAGKPLLEITASKGKNSTKPKKGDK